MGAGREEFRDAGGFESGLRETDGCAEAGTAGSYDDRVIVVVYYGVVEMCGGGGGGSSSLGLAEEGPALHVVDKGG